MQKTAENQMTKALQPITIWLYSFWKFSRPHTIIGTGLSVISLYGIALITFDAYPSLMTLAQLLGALLACWCGNIYIVGLNQLQDIDIDKINKPHLPLASEEFSLKQGKWIVTITGILALGLSAFLGQWLLATVVISLAIGTLYSLPPVRLKRFPLLAAFCIFTVRGVIVNLGVFLHFSQLFTEQIYLPFSIWLLTGFIILFTVAIAIFKDVPDLEGDKKYNITTYTIILGKPLIFRITQGIVFSCYAAMIVLVLLPITPINSWIFVGFHSGLMLLFAWRSQRVDLENKAEIARFYQFIWKLFFLEYLLFPFSLMSVASL